MKGVIVGADRKIEWLLDFWWSHYSKYNQFPVTFVDFGMTEKAKKWCRQRGTVLPLTMQPLTPHKSKIDPLLAQQWELLYGKSVWKMRQSWFKKPFALLQTPYGMTIWLDLDCQVLGPLEPLFDSCCEGIAMACETAGAHTNEQLLEGEVLYNSGVIVYQKGVPIIKKWAEAALTLSEQFSGDQQLLSRLIFLNKVTVQELEPECNWRMSQGVNIHALIIHWVGEWGKTFIRKNYLLK